MTAKEARMTQPLHGLSILIVEDEAIIAMMLVNEIERAGGTAIGPATSVAEALREIASTVIDVALVDSKLADGSATDLVAAFARRGIPYIVVSGYEEANLPALLKGGPFVAKPISLPQLFEAIDAVRRAALRSSATASARGPGVVDGD